MAIKSRVGHKREKALSVGPPHSDSHKLEVPPPLLSSPERRGQRRRENKVQRGLSVSLFPNLQIRLAFT